MELVGFKDLPRRTAADKVLHDKAFNFAFNSFNQRRLTSMVYNFFDKMTSGGASSEIMPNKKLAKELHNQLLECLRNEKYTHIFYR